MQLEIMLFFQRINNPFLTFLANFFSFFGENTFIIIAVTIFYWCIDKKKGFVILSNLAIALMTMNIIKPIVKAPRPFQAYPDLIKGERIATATGYSFPSGHSTGASSVFSSIAYHLRSWIVKAVCIVFIIGVPLSRLYLGVHWPIDVMTGTVLGLGITVFIGPYCAALYDDKKLLKTILMPISVTLIAFASVLTVMLQFFDANKTAFSDLMTTASLVGFGLLGASIELRSTDFVPAKEMKNKVLCFAIGFICIAAIDSLGSIIPESFESLGRFFRYSTIGLLATLIMPRLFIKLKLVKEKSYYTSLFRDAL